jgi:hypothetical protein
MLVTSADRTSLGRGSALVHEREALGESALGGFVEHVVEGAPAPAAVGPSSARRADALHGACAFLDEALDGRRPDGFAEANDHGSSDLVA